MALVIVIVAEMFIGSDNGLGHRIIDAQQVLNVKSMYAAILAAGVPVARIGRPRLHLPAQQDWGFRAAFIIDPDGTQLTLIEDAG